MTEALGAAARLTWASIAGPELDADARALLGAGLGGVVLFSRNIRSPEQLATLCADIRAAAAGPVRISIDQEGGHIVRVGPPLTHFPSPMAIGATRDPRIAYAVARAAARELAVLGIDVVLAPVLDLAADLRSAVVGARAYGSDPRLVARLGAAAVRGYLDGGLLPMPKHFPGHGRTPADSHLVVPAVDGTLEELLAADIPPYRAAIAAGAPAVMTAHVVHRAMDPIEPATLSTRSLVDLARTELGFDGLIVTDALVMDAIAQVRPVGTAAVAAILAGADVVMALDAGWRTIDALEAAILSGAIPEERLRAALARIDAFDQAADAARSRIPRRVSVALHGRLVRRIARSALTLVHDDAGLLPLRSDASVVLVDVASPRASPVEDERGETWSIGAAVCRQFPRARVVRVETGRGGGIGESIDAARGADVVLVVTRDAFTSPEAALVVGALGPATVRIALRSPADLVLEPRPETAIAAYADTAATADAIAAALAAGPVAFRGRLPVPLPSSPPEAARTRPATVAA